MNLKIKTFIYCILMVICGSSAYGQMSGANSQYLLHEQLINPALTGLDKCSIYKGLFQQQSWGQSPYLNSQILLTESQYPGSKYNLHGLGLNVSRLGGQTLNYYSLSGAYAYNTMLNWNKGLRLAVGVQASLYNVGFDGFTASNDEIFSRTYSGVNMSPGLSLYNETFFMNLGYNNLVQDAGYSQDIHPGNIMAHTGFYAGNTTSYLHYSPSVAVFISPEGDIVSHVNISFNYKNNWWSALSLRALPSEDSGLDPGLAAGIGYTYKRIRLKYAVQIQTPDFPSNNYGTHNLMIGFRFCPKRCGCAEEF